MNGVYVSLNSTVIKLNRYCNMHVLSIYEKTAKSHQAILQFQVTRSGQESTDWHRTPLLSNHLYLWRNPWQIANVFCSQTAKWINRWSWWWFPAFVYVYIDFS